MVYGGLDVAAGADEKVAQGFCGGSLGVSDRILAHVHGDF